MTRRGIEAVVDEIGGRVLGARLVAWSGTWNPLHSCDCRKTVSEFLHKTIVSAKTENALYDWSL